MATGYGYPLFNFAINYCYGYWLLLMAIDYYYGYRLLSMVIEFFGLLVILRLNFKN
jgi:hypothetical protein